MKPQTRKDKIKAKARNKKVEVQGRKLTGLTSSLDRLEKRLKKLEDKA